MNLFRLGIGPGRILYQPGGILPDIANPYSLMGLVSNLNNYAVHLFDIVHAGTAVVLNGIQATAGVPRLIGAASGPFTVTLPITDRLVDALGPTVPMDGSFAVPISLQNEDPLYTATLTAGDGRTTLNGTMTVAPGTRRIWLLTLVDKLHVSIQNIGTFAVTGAVGQATHTISCTYNDLPGASANFVIVRHPLPFAVTFSSGLPGSDFLLDPATPAAAQTDIDIRRSTDHGVNYSSIGTARFAIAGFRATIIFAATVACAQFDVIEWRLPAMADATAAGFGGTMLGVRP